MLGAATQLQRYGITVNAVESRQFLQGLYVLQAMRADGTLPRRVVVSLGTNGPMTSADFDTMMRTLQGTNRVVIVNVKEPRWWEGQVNQVLRAGVSRWKKARLADWYDAAMAHPEWTCCDEIHLTPAGGRAYAQIVWAALRSK